MIRTEKQDTDMDSIFMPPERRIALINQVRNKTTAKKSSYTCFARHYMPNHSFSRFRALEYISLNSYASTEEIEESLHNAIEAMMVAEHTEQDIVDAALRMHLGLISRMKIKRLMDNIRDSRHYAILLSLVQE